MRGTARLRTVPPVPAPQRPPLLEEQAAVQGAKGAYGESEGGAGFYFQLSAQGLMCRTGHYAMAKEQLAGVRAAVDAEAPGSNCCAARS